MVVTEDKKDMVAMDHKDMVATKDNEDAEATENREVKAMPRRFIPTLFIQSRPRFPKENPLNMSSISPSFAARS